MGLSMAGVQTEESEHLRSGPYVGSEESGGMPDRETELRALAASVSDHPAVVDAWVAKSFTDRMVVVDVRAGADLPTEIGARLAAHDLRGANDVYDTGAGDDSFAGTAKGAARHQFVDTRTRGEHQSYVVE